VKKGLLLVLVALMLAPGCGNRKKSSVHDTANQSTKYKKNDAKSVFDEDVESFVLEEGQNPFAAPKDGDSVKLVDEKDSLWGTERRQGEFETIYFDFDKDTIRPDQKAILARDATKIKAHTDKGEAVMVEGHACKAGGSVTYNMALSERRARNVRSELVKQGVSHDLLKVVGRGNQMCLVEGGTKEQQAPNRRVEFYMLEEKKS
jgi:outer membrane protein OmpA-like peptidoglycan-associated protein